MASGKLVDRVGVLEIAQPANTEGLGAFECWRLRLDDTTGEAQLEAPCELGLARVEEAHALEQPSGAREPEDRPHVRQDEAVLWKAGQRLGEFVAIVSVGYGVDLRPITE